MNLTQIGWPNIALLMELLILPARMACVSFVFALGLCLGGCSHERTPDESSQAAETQAVENRSIQMAQATGTQRMVRRLATIADNIPPLSSPFTNYERLAYLWQP